jgi:hypothetical protein
MRKYALVSSQGTACAETVLYEDEYTPERRAYIEANIVRSMPAIDRPVLGSWTDVTDNDAL